MTKQIRGRILIDQPAEVVFDEVCDIRNEPSYNPNMLSVDLLTEEPVGEGSQFRAEVKSRNDNVTMLITYTDFRRPEYIGSRSVSNNMEVNGGLTFSSVDSGTLLEWSWYVELRGNLKLFGPFVTILGKRQEQKIWQGLKEKLETPI